MKHQVDALINLALNSDDSPATLKIGEQLDALPYWNREQKAEYIFRRGYCDGWDHYFKFTKQGIPKPPKAISFPGNTAFYHYNLGLHLVGTIRRASGMADIEFEEPDQLTKNTGYLQAAGIRARRCGVFILMPTKYPFHEFYNYSN